MNEIEQKITDALKPVLDAANAKLPGCNQVNAFYCPDRPLPYIFVWHGLDNYSGDGFDALMKEIPALGEEKQKRIDRLKSELAALEGGQ